MNVGQPLLYQAEDHQFHVSRQSSEISESANESYPAALRKSLHIPTEA